MTMNALTQWSLVGIAVVLATGYAVKALLPRAWRATLVRLLKARGATALAKSLERGTGCDACAARPQTDAARSVTPVTSENLTRRSARREDRGASP